MSSIFYKKKVIGACGLDGFENNCTHLIYIWLSPIMQFS